MPNLVGGLLSGVGTGLQQTAKLHERSAEREQQTGLLNQRQAHTEKMEEKRFQNNLTVDELRAEKNMALEKYRSENQMAKQEDEQKFMAGEKEKDRALKREGGDRESKRTQNEQLTVSKKINEIGKQIFGDGKQEFVVGREIKGDLPTSDTISSFSEQVGQEFKAKKTKDGFIIVPADQESKGGSTTLGVLNLEGMSDSQPETKKVKIDGKEYTATLNGSDWSIQKDDGKTYILPNKG